MNMNTRKHKRNIDPHKQLQIIKTASNTNTATSTPNIDHKTNNHVISNKTEIAVPKSVQNDVDVYSVMQNNYKPPVNYIFHPSKCVSIIQSPKDYISYDIIDYEITEEDIKYIDIKLKNLYELCDQNQLKNRMIEIFEKCIDVWEKDSHNCEIIPDSRAFGLVREHLSNYNIKGKEDFWIKDYYNQWKDKRSKIQKIPLIRKLWRVPDSNQMGNCVAFRKRIKDGKMGLRKYTKRENELQFKLKAIKEDYLSLWALQEDIKQREKQKRYVLKFQTLEFQMNTADALKKNKEKILSKYKETLNNRNMDVKDRKEKEKIIKSIRNKSSVNLLKEKKVEQKEDNNFIPLNTQILKKLKKEDSNSQVEKKDVSDINSQNPSKIEPTNKFKFWTSFELSAFLLQIDSFHPNVFKSSKEALKLYKEKQNDEVIKDDSVPIKYNNNENGYFNMPIDNINKTKINNNNNKQISYQDTDDLQIIKEKKEYQTNNNRVQINNDKVDESSDDENQDKIYNQNQYNISYKDNDDNENDLYKKLKKYISPSYKNFKNKNKCNGKNK